MRKKRSSCNIITRANHQLRELTAIQLPPSSLRPAGSMPPATPGRRGKGGGEREREGRKDGRTGGRKKGRERRGHLRRLDGIKETEGGESERARDRELKGGIRPRAGEGERMEGQRQDRDNGGRERDSPMDLSSLLFPTHPYI